MQQIMWYHKVPFQTVVPSANMGCMVKKIIGYHMVLFKISVPSANMWPEGQVWSPDMKNVASLVTRHQYIETLGSSLKPTGWVV